MALERITAVDAALLAQTWANAGLCRAWLKRRSATPEGLGLDIVRDGPLVRLVARSPAADVVQVRPEPQAPPAPPGGQHAGEAFESWAVEVDGHLEAANEPPAPDPLLASLFDEGLSPAAAADEIVARRLAELDRSLSDAEAHCADCRPELACWGAPDQCQVRLDSHADGAAETQAALPGTDESQPAPGDVTLAATDRALAVTPKPAPVTPAAAERADFHVRLAAGMPLDDARRMARAIAGAFGVGVHVCDAYDGRVVDALVGAAL